MDSAWHTRTSMAASTTTLRRTTLAISRNISAELHRSFYENRKAPQALSHRAREALQPQRSRPSGHARFGVRTKAAGEGTAGGRRPGIEPPAGYFGGGGLVGPSFYFSGR